MIFTKNESIEDRVIRLLAEAPGSVSEIWRKIASQGQPVTLQAVYKAVRQLLADSVIVKSKQQCMISAEWRVTLGRLMSAQRDLPELSSGESVSYSFRNLESLDAYWKHLVFSLEAKLSNFPVYIYNPFGIWIHLSGRYASESSYLKEFTEKKKLGFLLLGNKYATDAQLKREFQSDFLQIATQNLLTFSKHYISIFGNHIVTTKFEKRFYGEVTQLYKTVQDVQELSRRLKWVLTKPWQTKLILECSPKKATSLRKKFSRNFYVPQSLKSKYKLC